MPTNLKNVDPAPAPADGKAAQTDPEKADAGKGAAREPKVRRRYRVQLVYPKTYLYAGRLVRRGDVIEVGARDRNYLVKERGNFEDLDDNAPRGMAKVPEDDDRTIEVVYRFQHDNSDLGEETDVRQSRRAARATASGRRRRARSRGVGSEIANARARASMPANFEPDDGDAV